MTFYSFCCFCVARSNAFLLSVEKIIAMKCFIDEQKERQKCFVSLWENSFHSVIGQRVF